MAKKIRFWNKLSSFHFITAAIVIIAIGTIGSVLLIKSHAANTLSLGVYEGYANVSGVNSFATETKAPVAIGAEYLDGSTWQTIESGVPAGSWTGSGYQLQLGVDLLPNSGASIATGATGAYNQYFTTLAQNLVADGEGNAILHIGWEWDTGANPWSIAGGDATAAANLAAYWRQIVTSMRAVPGANFNYAWYYSAQWANAVQTVNGTTVDQIAFPGSSYVSSIDLDFYDQSWDGNCGLPYNMTNFNNPQSYEGTSSEVTPTQSNCIWNGDLLNELNGYASFASSKNEPMGFGEWGVITRSDGHGLGDDPTFVNNFTNWVKSNNVEYISYFDFNSGGNSILSAYPQALAAYQTDLGGSTSTPPPPPAVPTVPTNVTATANNSTSISVKWTASTDTGGPGIGSYKIFRAGSTTALTSVGATSTSYTDNSVSPTASYSYTVEACDTANVCSSQSAASPSVTPPAFPLPSVPANVKATNNSSTSVTVSWSSSTDTGGPGLAGYNVYNGSTKVNSSLVTGTTYTDTALAGNTQYSFTVKAVDIDGNSSAASVAAVGTTPAGTDTTPPSVPTGVSAKVNSSTSISVSWNASTDSTGGGGIFGYYVLRSSNGSNYTTVAGPASGTSYTDNSVVASTSYTYEIEAKDVVGNVSNPSLPSTSVTTPATNVTPAAPVLTATAASTSQINLSWTESTPNVAAFVVYNCNNNGLAILTGTTTSWGATGLSANTKYCYYVVAYNSSSLASAHSNQATATTLSAPPSSTYATGSITGIDNKCLDNHFSIAANGNKINLWNCNGTGAQKWTYNPNNGEIVNSNGYCLNVSNQSGDGGTYVDLYQCNDSSTQRWLVKSPQGVAGTIVNPSTGSCLDDKFSGTSNGNPIWIYWCNGSNAQKWTVN